MAVIRGNDILRVARKLGYQVRRPKRRKHYVIFVAHGLSQSCGKGKVKKGTLEAIIKDLGLTKEEFNRMV